MLIEVKKCLIIHKFKYLNPLSRNIPIKLVVKLSRAFFHAKELNYKKKLDFLAFRNQGDQVNLIGHERHDECDNRFPQFWHRS